MSGLNHIVQGPHGRKLPGTFGPRFDMRRVSISKTASARWSHCTLDTCNNVTRLMILEAGQHFGEEEELAEQKDKIRQGAWPITFFPSMPKCFAAASRRVSFE